MHVMTDDRPTTEEVLAGIRAIAAVAETVRELGRVPSGTVYAALMSKGVTFSGYEKILGILDRAGLVRQTQGHELVWIGPTV
jgi:hypothetical protein